MQTQVQQLMKKAKLQYSVEFNPETMHPDKIMELLSEVNPCGENLIGHLVTTKTNIR